MNKTAVFSVIFPNNLPFFMEYIESVNKQTISSFDLVLINDGIEENELKKYLVKLKNNYLVYTVSGLSIVKNRIYGIQKLLDAKYDYVVFADTDDLLSPNRVEASVEFLKNHDIVFNDLCIVNETVQIVENHYWKNRVNNKRIDRDFIIDKNVLGLGNTAINSRVIDNFHADVNDNIIAFDWLFFWYLLRNKDAYFIKDVSTIYRQHEDNCIGLKDITLERIEFILKVKQLHYRSLIADFSFLEKNFIDTENLQKNLDIYESIQFFENSSSINFFWWEETNYLI